MAAKRMTGAGRVHTAMSAKKRQALAVDLFNCGMSFQGIADTLGYTHRSGARIAYLAGLAVQAREGTLTAA